MSARYDWICHSLDIHVRDWNTLLVGRVQSMLRPVWRQKNTKVSRLMCSQDYLSVHSILVSILFQTRSKWRWKGWGE